MNIELPVLRLGLAGFSEAQQNAAADLAAGAPCSRCGWQIGGIADADAWWLEGSRTLLLPSGFLRVQPGVPSGRSVQISLNEVDRPVAFTLPLAAPGFQPAVTFALGNAGAAHAVLDQFAAWMQNMLSQFCLASSLNETQPTLGAGSWEVIGHGGDLLAVVDLKLGAAIAPGSQADDFAEAIWSVRDHGSVVIPHGYPRISVSQLMWQFALRTQRDLLPPHYREQALYFRRPPRLPQRQLRDAHLLLLRELVASPGLSFRQLQQATGLGEGALARHLSALYVVGSITSNARRALGAAARPSTTDSVPAGSSVFVSELDPAAFTEALLRPGAGDMTAPAPLLPDRTLPAALLPNPVAS